MNDYTRAHVRITGRVQGVCYRMETHHAAMKFDVKGWVRNRPDGSVEAVFEGEKGCVDLLIDWCRRGPSHAKVQHVDIQWEEYSGEFDGFEITY